MIGSLNDILLKISDILWKISEFFRKISEENLNTSEFLSNSTSVCGELPNSMSKFYLLTVSSYRKEIKKVRIQVRNLDTHLDVYITNLEILNTLKQQCLEFSLQRCNFSERISFFLAFKGNNSFASVVY